MILPAESHAHGPGEERAKCPNCILADMEGQMTEFERTMLGWFLNFGNQFCIEAGITQAEWLSLQFESDADKSIAVEILKTLDTAVKKISAEKIGDKHG